MGDHNQKAQPLKGAHDEARDKAAAEARPDEARMSEIAKRLMATPPERTMAGKALVPKTGGRAMKR